MNFLSRFGDACKEAQELISGKARSLVWIGWRGATFDVEGLSSPACDCQVTLTIATQPEWPHIKLLHASVAFELHLSSCMLVPRLGHFYGSVAG